METQEKYYPDLVVHHFLPQAFILLVRQIKARVASLMWEKHRILNGFLPLTRSEPHFTLFPSYTLLIGW